MSALTDRIAEVLRRHKWHNLRCCRDATDHDAHVAERIEAELQLAEDLRRINPQTKAKPCDNCGHLKGIHASPCRVPRGYDGPDCGCPEHSYTPPNTTWERRWVSAWTEVNR